MLRPRLEPQACAPQDLFASPLNMLPKRLRIKVNDFNKIPQKAIKRFSRNFNFYLKHSRNGMRFVINVPKSLDKRATKRNYTKRIIEQVILSVNKELNGKKLVLIRAKEVINKEKRKFVERELKKILIDEFSNKTNS